MNTFVSCYHDEGNLRFFLLHYKLKYIMFTPNFYYSCNKSVISVTSFGISKCPLEVCAKNCVSDVFYSTVYE